jgi:hypothetical protein
MIYTYLVTHISKVIRCAQIAGHMNTVLLTKETVVHGTSMWPMSNRMYAPHSVHEHDFVTYNN